MRFIEHSVYDNWTVRADGSNVSTIIDKLIRLAAKNTEYYASDICFTIEKLKHKVQNEEKYITYLAFRDGGISEFSSAEAVNPYSIGEIVQWWRLSHEPKNGYNSLTLLTRMDLCR